MKLCKFKLICKHLQKKIISTLRNIRILSSLSDSLLQHLIAFT
jgi:hypothetical protein